MEWWINNSGANLLEGDPDDTANPIRLPDDYILDFLLRIPAARLSFERLVPNLSAAAQTRLRALAERAQIPLISETAASDITQSVLNKSGVRTAGRRGGTRVGGNG